MAHTGVVVNGKWVVLYREQVLTNFKDHINTDLLALEQDVTGLNNIEKRTEVTLSFS